MSAFNKQQPRMVRSVFGDRGRPPHNRPIRPVVNIRRSGCRGHLQCRIRRGRKLNFAVHHGDRLIVVYGPGRGPVRPPSYLTVLVYYAVHDETEQEYACHGHELGTRFEVILTGVVYGRPDVLLPSPVGQLTRQLRERQALR